MPQGHYGEYSGNHPKFSKKYDHAHTHVTDHNLDSTKKDDEAHIDYLKRDINWDDKHGHSDEKMTADEKHITYLAEDEKYDEKHHSMAKNLGSPTKQIFGGSTFAKGIGTHSDEEKINFAQIHGSGAYSNPTTVGIPDSLLTTSGGTEIAEGDGTGGGYDITAAENYLAKPPEAQSRKDALQSQIDKLSSKKEKGEHYNPAHLTRLQGKLDRTTIRQENRAKRIADRNVKKKQRVGDWQAMRNMDTGKQKVKAGWNILKGMLKK